MGLNEDLGDRENVGNASLAAEKERSVPICKWCSRPESQHSELTIEGRIVRFCDHNERTSFTPAQSVVPIPEDLKKLYESDAAWDGRLMVDFALSHGIPMPWAKEPWVCV